MSYTQIIYLAMSGICLFSQVGFAGQELFFTCKITETAREGCVIERIKYMEEDDGETFLDLEFLPSKKKKTIRMPMAVAGEIVDRLGIKKIEPQTKLCFYTKISPFYDESILSRAIPIVFSPLTINLLNHFKDPNTREEALLPMIQTYNIMAKLSRDESNPGNNNFPDFGYEVKNIKEDVTSLPVACIEYYGNNDATVLIDYFNTRYYEKLAIQSGDKEKIRNSLKGVNFLILHLYTEQVEEGQEKPGIMCYVNRLETKDNKGINITNQDDSSISMTDQEKQENEEKAHNPAAVRWSIEQGKSSAGKAVSLILNEKTKNMEIIDSKETVLNQLNYYEALSLVESIGLGNEQLEKVYFISCNKETLIGQYKGRRANIDYNIDEENFKKLSSYVGTLQCSGCDRTVDYTIQTDHLQGHSLKREEDNSAFTIIYHDTVLNKQSRHIFIALDDGFVQSLSQDSTPENVTYLLDTNIGKIAVPADKIYMKRKSATPDSSTPSSKKKTYPHTVLNKDLSEGATPSWHKGTIALGFSALLATIIICAWQYDTILHMIGLRA